MKKKKRTVFLLTIVGVVLAGMLLVKPGYYLYRETAYRLREPNGAEQRVYAYAHSNGIPYGRYPEALIELLARNPETEAFVLNYPFRQETLADLSGYPCDQVPLLLQWDPLWGYAKYGSGFLAVTGCGPTCLAMVRYYLTGDAATTPDKIAAFAEKAGYYAPGYGSSWKLISEGSQKLGLSAKELPLVKKKMVDALEAGNPVILALGKGDFTSTGHYIVLTGVEDGAFRVNDPNSIIRSQKLWTYEALEHQIRNIWAISLYNPSEI